MAGYWAVVRTRANSERRACENLKRQNFEFYFPRYKRKKGAREFICALFPRYMFINILDRWHSIMSTYGVERLLLRNDGEPCRISDEVISSLRKSEDVNGFVQLEEANENVFKKGQMLLVTRGPFMNKRVIYQHSTIRDREIVLLSLLGRFTPISIDHGDLVRL